MDVIFAGCRLKMVARVIVATDSEIKRAAFESSEIATHLRALGVNYEFMNVDGSSEFDGVRWAQPFTASGGIFAAMQRISAVRGDRPNGDMLRPIQHYDDMLRPIQHYDESGMLLGVSPSKTVCCHSDLIVIAIESFITDNAKDVVCIVVNYYDSDGKKRELVSFSPAAYIASFPEKYLQHIAIVSKHQKEDKGFNMTIGDAIDLDKHLYGGGMSKNWHKLFNPFDRVEQIRGTLDYIADEFKKIVS
jgi:hypothetical protein